MKKFISVVGALTVVLILVFVGSSESVDSRVVEQSPPGPMSYPSYTDSTGV